MFLFLFNQGCALDWTPKIGDNATLSTTFQGNLLHTILKEKVATDNRRKRTMIVCKPSMSEKRWKHNERTATWIDWKLVGHTNLPLASSYELNVLFSIDKKGCRRWQTQSNDNVPEQKHASDPPHTETEPRFGRSQNRR